MPYVTKLSLGKIEKPRWKHEGNTHTNKNLVPPPIHTKYKKCLQDRIEFAMFIARNYEFSISEKLC